MGECSAGNTRIHFHPRKTTYSEKKILKTTKPLIANFKVVFLVTCPLSGSKTGVDFVLIETLVLFQCKCKGSIRTTCESTEVCVLKKVPRFHTNSLSTQD